MTMSPIQILDELIAEYSIPYNNIQEQFIRTAFGNRIEALNEAKERIDKECTIRISGGDNDYDIPYGLVTQFNKDCHCDFQEPDEEWYEWCENFDSKYAQYQV